MSHEGVNQEKFVLHSQRLFEDDLCTEMLISHSFKAQQFECGPNGKFLQVVLSSHHIL